jgi:hypothetical protein
MDKVQKTCNSERFSKFNRSENGVPILSAPALYSEGPGFKPRYGDGVSGLRLFMVFLSPATQFPGCFLESGHN